MKKVPILQERSKKQHQKDEIDAEISFLENITKITNTNPDKSNEMYKNTQKNLNIFQKFLHYIDNLFKK